MAAGAVSDCWEARESAAGFPAFGEQKRHVSVFFAACLETAYGFAP